MSSPDVVVVGAGVVGAACAFAAARAGLSVTVVDRGPVAGGTSGAGEGNLLVSDRPPGPELELGLLSIRLWRDLAADLGGPIEYEAKGGLVVAAQESGMEALGGFAARQRAAGVRAIPVPAGDLAGHEPQLAPGLAGGMFYPDDAQVQPMLATAHLLRAARQRYRTRVMTGTIVTGFLTSTGLATGSTLGAARRVAGVRTSAGDIAAGAVINAAGTWAGNVAALAGARLPIQPRRGFVLVTEPLPVLIRHKVYAAEYVANVASDAAGLETSAVVEGTRAGTVLIGASRERVGFDRTVSVPVLRRLARQAIGLFPVLADVAAIRTYCGFRPYSPDHLPVIGPDPRVPGLLHAGGHEGGGICLSAATGHLLAQVLTGATPDVDLAPFRPDRFAEAAA